MGVSRTQGLGFSKTGRLESSVGTPGSVPDPKCLEGRVQKAKEKLRDMEPHWTYCFFLGKHWVTCDIGRSWHESLKNTKETVRFQLY